MELISGRTGRALVDKKGRDIKTAHILSVDMFDINDQSTAHGWVENLGRNFSKY